jgi:hypothetical protein
VFGSVNVKVVVQEPIAVIVKEPSIKVVLPCVFDRAEFTVKVAVPHVGVGVKGAHAVPVSPVPPLATATGVERETVQVDMQVDPEENEIPVPAVSNVRVPDPETVAHDGTPLAFS